jgi:hypothetical protein
MRHGEGVRDTREEAMRSRIARGVVAAIAAASFALVAACEVENGEFIEEDDPLAPEQEENFEDDDV